MSYVNIRIKTVINTRFQLRLLNIYIVNETTSQISQLNTLQGLSNIGTSDSKVSDSSSIFESLLEKIMQNTATNNVSSENNSANSIGGTSEVASSKDAISWLSSLFIYPQKLMQMMLSSQNTNSSAINIGTDGSDDNSSDDTSMIGSNDEATQMINSPLQTAMQNQGTNASNSINLTSIILYDGYHL